MSTAAAVVSKAASRVVKRAGLEEQKKILAEREQKLAEAQAERADLLAQRDAAMAAALDEDLTNSPFEVGTKADKIRQKIRTLDATIEGLETKIPLRRSKIHAATATKAARI